MAPRELAALLRILTKYGVTEYRDGDVCVKLGPAPAPRVRPIDGDGSDEPDDEEQVDPAFALEKLYAEKRGGK